MSTTSLKSSHMPTKVGLLPVHGGIWEQFSLDVLPAAPVTHTGTGVS